MAGSLTLLLVAKPTPEAFWAGLPLVAVGQMIRVWAAGYLTKLSGLVTAGPFALCRNPLYVGSFLISLGYMTMCHRTIVFVAGTALFWLLHAGAVAYEEQLLRDKFGEDYLHYCQEVPRFIPRPRSLIGHGDFSLKRVMANDEGRGAAVIALLAACFGWMAFESFSVLNWLYSLAD